VCSDMNEVLRLESVSKKYGKKAALTDYSVSLKKGQVCGLTGHSGAGKTTVMNIISGLTSFDSGKLVFFSGKVSHRQARHRIGFVTERLMINPAMTVFDNLEYMRFLRGVSEKRKTDELISFAGLSEYSSVKVRKISYDMKKRLGFAMALTGDPEIVMLDGIFKGVDSECVSELKEMIRKLSEERKVSFIISSHKISELMDICTDFSVLKNGEPAENVNIDELLTRCRKYISIKTDDIDRTAAVIEEKMKIYDYQVINDEELRIFSNTDDIRALSKAVTDSGIIITGLSCISEPIDDHYQGEGDRL